MVIENENLDLQQILKGYGLNSIKISDIIQQLHDTFLLNEWKI